MGDDKRTCEDCKHWTRETSPPGSNLGICTTLFEVLYVEVEDPSNGGNLEPEPTWIESPEDFGCNRFEAKS